MYIVELSVPKEKLMDVIENFESEIDYIEVPPQIGWFFSTRYKIRLKFHSTLKEVMELLQKHGLDNYIDRIYGH